MPRHVILSPSTPAYQFSTVLAGDTFIFDVHWNATDAAWYMNVSTAAGVLIAAGLKLVLGALVGGRVVDPRWPRGVFRLFDSTNSGVDAGFDDMGDRVRLYFYPIDEL